ncbi:5'-3' exonuclease H3TH domain-containing protein [Actinoplanes sp. NPDC051411]|uniref:5'-3' exonuclease n=1 Tax=Actinoplanes sp. NPDC051411 TaxID=3155522 RepID=UPI003422AE05
MRPRLLAVDGHHLLYRSWFGFPTRIRSRDGTRDLTGIFGFLAILRKTHRELLPDAEIIVAFDGEHATDHRRSQDSSYKATRAEMDHTPIASLNSVKDALTTIGVAWIELDDHEGDDVIATLSASAEAEGRTVTCFSGDRDLHQLAAPAVTILTPDRRWITPEAVLARHHVTPAQWPDFRALTGDPTDNIPGVRGVGPRTAATLLAGGIHLDDLPDSGRLNSARGQAITSIWDQLLTWRDLIRLDRQVPLKPGLTTGLATAELPRAATILETLELW